MRVKTSFNLNKDSLINEIFFSFYHFIFYLVCDGNVQNLGLKILTESLLILVILEHVSWKSEDTHLLLVVALRLYMGREVRPLATKEM